MVFVVLGLYGFVVPWFQEITKVPFDLFLIDIGLIPKVFEILINGSSGLFGARLFLKLTKMH